jgi:hypothetical protein
VRINQVTQPAVEPIDLATAKLHCRVEITDDDTYITGLISAARKICEARSHLCFITQTIDIFLDNWTTSNVASSGFTGYFGGGNQTGSTIYSNSHKGNQITLPHGPVQSITYVKYTDPNQTTQTWDSTNYVASLGNPSRVAPVQNTFWPSVASQNDAVNIRYVAGYGDDGTSVPQVAKQAILLMVNHLYENRLAVTSDSQQIIPFGVDELLSTLTCGNNLFF